MLRHFFVFSQNQRQKHEDGGGQKPQPQHTLIDKEKTVFQLTKAKPVYSIIQFSLRIEKKERKQSFYKNINGSNNAKHKQ